MEVRKLIGFGKSSLVVSLPKGWLTDNKLKKGATVFLHEAEDELVISSKDTTREREQKVLQIQTDNKELDKIAMEIVSGYLRNYDVWELRGKNLATLGPKVKEQLQNLAGLELMEQDANKIVAKDMLDMHELSIHALLRRIDLILRSMLQDATGHTGGDFYDSIFSRDVDVNRLVFLAKRVINLALEDHQVAKKLERSPRQLAIDMQMANLLESMGDDIKRVSRFMKTIDPAHKAFKMFVAFNAQLQEHYLDAMKAYYTNNEDLAYKVLTRHKGRMEQIDQIAKIATAHTAQRCLYHMKGINSHIKNIARFVLN